MSLCRRPCSIVLIDDEPMILAALSAFLELEDLGEAVCFERGADALAHIEAHSADLVICDMLMPHLDGIEVLTRVRRIDPRIPRVLLTGYADRANAVRAIHEAGLFDYLEKPWDNSALHDVVTHALCERTALRCLSARAAERTMKGGCLQALQRRVLAAFKSPDDGQEPPVPVDTH